MRVALRLCDQRLSRWATPAQLTNPNRKIEQIKGAAEKVRLALALADLDFEDVRLNFQSEWPARKKRFVVCGGLDRLGERRWQWIGMDGVSPLV